MTRRLLTDWGTTRKAVSCFRRFHRRGTSVVLALVVIAVMGIAGTGSGGAATTDVGFRDQSYSGAGADASGSKPESKLWWNDGFWWASMWETGSQDFHIFRLDRATQSWIDTGVTLDNRAGTRADTLWDGTHLYVASHVFSTSPASGYPSRLYRYSYSQATHTYSLDAGFPVSINNYRTETLVIDKDSTGEIWATWMQGNTVYVNRTVGGDATWGTPFVLPVSGTSATSDDISSVVAFGGNKIGVMWSNQLDSAMYFAVHEDGQADTSWDPSRTAIAGPNYADDHINLKSLQSDGSGRVFAAVKTSLNDLSNANPNAPLIMLLVRDAAGNWSSYPYGRVTDDHTRPIVLLDETNGIIHMFATAPVSGGVIYEKTSPIDAISFAQGLGTPFIADAASADMNNATSTKQNVNATTGLVVLATNNATGYYWHNYEPLSSPAPLSASFTGTPTSGAAPLAVSFTDTSSGSPTTWSWDFGDGTTSTLQNPTHTYATTGTYTVTLGVANATGTDTTTQPDYVVVTSPPSPPTADFSGTPTSGPTPLTVSFTDTSSGGPTTWSWAFGDGGTSTAQNPTHTYASLGSYTVSLTVSNASGGDTKTVADYIAATAPPPDFALGAAPAKQTVSQGDSTRYTITVTPLNAFSGVVDLSVAGVPPGATATFETNPLVVSGSSSSVLSIATTSTTKLGAGTLVITGTSGALSHTTSVGLQVRKK
jgi:PKD repeat protein